MGKRDALVTVVLAIAAGLIGGFVATRTFPSTSIKTEEIRLVGKDGKTLAELGPNRDGEPVLRMYDQKGKARVFLGMGSYRMPRLELADGSARPVVILALEFDEQPSLNLFDPLGYYLARLGTDRLAVGGQPNLMLFPRDAKPGRQVTNVWTDGLGVSVGLRYRASPLPAVHLSPRPDGNGGFIALRDKAGEELWRAP